MARTPRRSGGRRSQQSTPRTPRTPSSATANAAMTPSSGRGSDGLFSNGQWFCDCKPRRPAVLRETRKPGTNNGRWFYTCPQERRRQCTFFLWEDYAGVSGGGGAGAGPSSSQPRPTYRTSIGRRTTPPAEQQVAQLASIPGQRPLPPPAPPVTRQRQRIFTTPLGGVLGNTGSNETNNSDGDDNDDDDSPLPPTPTPVRTRQLSDGGAAVTETPSHRITKYFGVVEKGGAAREEKEGKEGKEGSEGNEGNEGERGKPPSGRTASEYSDSEFDSDMERALVALADHSEQATRRWRSGGAGSDPKVRVEEEETEDVAMDIDRARRIVVPVRGDEAPAHELATPTRRGGRRLLVASEEYAAKEAAAAALASKDTAPSTSFASLFGGGDNDLPRQQPLPNFSFSSSLPSSSAALSQTPTQASIGTTAVTTPSSSFRSDLGAESGQKRRRAVDPWYGTNEDDGSGDEDDSDRDPFTSTPSKRVRFREASNGDETEAGRRETLLAPSVPTTPPPSTDKGKKKEAVMARGGGSPQRRWDEDDGMHVDRGEGEVDEAVVGRGNRPKDHNVTLAVLQLLAGQPINARVRQQVRALLNGAFDEQGA